jgi:RNA polymerase sigma-70 factor, ECF subfamily
MGRERVAEPIQEMLASARRRWPGIEVSDAAFARRAAQAGALADLHASDLYLAMACVAGHPQALSAFLGEIVPRARGAIAKTLTDPNLIQQAEDRVVQKLLVASDGKPPRLEEYAGRGTLASWVCVAAVRTAIEVSRLKAPASVPLDSAQFAAGVVAGAADLELIRRLHAEDFRGALAEALRGLAADERNLLRLSVLKDVGIDRLAVLFQAHRSTIARRLQRIRKKLLDDTRRGLGKRVGVRGAELDSLMRVVRSQLELSLSRLFSSPEQAEP